MITFLGFPDSWPNWGNLASSTKTLKNPKNSLPETLYRRQRRYARVKLFPSIAPASNSLDVVRQGLKKSVDRKITWTSFPVRFIRKLERWQYRHSWVGGGVTCWGCEWRWSCVRCLAAKKNVFAMEKEEISTASLLKGLTRRFISQQQLKHSPSKYKLSAKYLWFLLYLNSVFYQF